MAFKLKKTKIPSGELREIDEIQSFTLTWYTKGELYGSWNPHHKIFTNKDDAEIFLE